MFAELYKRGDELENKRNEQYDRGDKRAIEDGVEEEEHLYHLMSDLREEISKAGFYIPGQH